MRILIELDDAMIPQDLFLDHKALARSVSQVTLSLGSDDRADGGSLRLQPISVAVVALASLAPAEQPKEEAQTPNPEHEDFGNGETKTQNQDPTMATCEHPKESL